LRIKLKTLYAGFSNYLTEYGEWPQIPETTNLDTGDGEEAYWRFWITTMKQKDYGISESPLAVSHRPPRTRRQPETGRPR
jgi:hypothetical protein